jgi:hypothetical protein
MTDITRRGLLLGVPAMPWLLSQAQAQCMASITVNGSTGASVLAGAQIEISVAGGPGTTTDWVGLSEFYSPDNTQRTLWDYLNGTQSPPAAGLMAATFMMTAPQDPGGYEARFYYQDGFTVLARVPFVVETVGPVQISSADQITGAGTYSLQNDVAGDFSVTNFSNVTVLGNNHVITGLLTAGGGDATSGIVIQDLVVLGGLQVNGNNAAGQTALTVHLKNVVVISNAGVAAAVSGSNILIEGCNIGGNVQSTDDACQLWNGNPNRYVTFDGCIFGPDFDVGLEGLGSWDHVTCTNCVSHYGGIGGEYGPNFAAGNRSDAFRLTNSTFINNTIQFFAFSRNGHFAGAGTDQIANNLWGPDGNTFSGNTYPASTGSSGNSR